MMFLSPGDVEGETSEKLEIDDLLNENAVFLSPHRPCVSEGLGPKSEEKCCKVARFRDVAISLIFASQ